MRMLPPIPEPSTSLWKFIYKLSWSVCHILVLGSLIDSLFQLIFILNYPYANKVSYLRIAVNLASLLLAIWVLFKDFIRPGSPKLFPSEDIRLNSVLTKLMLLHTAMFITWSAFIFELYVRSELSKTSIGTLAWIAMGVIAITTTLINQSVNTHFKRKITESGLLLNAKSLKLQSHAAEKLESLSIEENAELIRLMGENAHRIYIDVADIVRVVTFGILIGITIQILQELLGRL